MIIPVRLLCLLLSVFRMPQHSWCSDNILWLSARFYLLHPHFLQTLIQFLITWLLQKAHPEEAPPFVLCLSCSSIYRGLGSR